MDSNTKGNIGEALVIAHYLNKGYEVFTAFGTASSFDLVVHKAGLLHRVSVKSTTFMGSKSSYVVNVGQRTRKGDIAFDSASCDIVAVVILPENRVLEVDAKTIHGKNKLTVKKMG